MTETLNQPVVGTDGKLDWRALLQDALDTPGDTMGNFSRFHQYSFLNTLLLYQQGARGPIASYQRWKGLGRQVMRGEKGMTIIRPINVKTRELDEHGEPKRILKFKPVNGAFQYSQTQGDEIPMPEVPEWDVDRALEKLDIKRVPFDIIEGNVHGYSFKRNVALNPVAPNPLGTIAHEVGHILCGHTTDENIAQYQTHRGTYEFEAEGTAYLAMKELGQLSITEASQSRGYLQSWMQTEQPSERSIRQVFMATDKLLRAGRPAVDEMVEFQG